MTHAAQVLINVKIKRGGVPTDRSKDFFWQVVGKIWVCFVQRAKVLWFTQFWAISICLPKILQRSSFSQWAKCRWTNWTEERPAFLAGSPHRPWGIWWIRVNTVRWSWFKWSWFLDIGWKSPMIKLVRVHCCGRAPPWYKFTTIVVNKLLCLTREGLFFKDLDVGIKRLV